MKIRLNDSGYKALVNNKGNVDITDFLEEELINSGELEVLAKNPKKKGFKQVVLVRNEGYSTGFFGRNVNEHLVCTRGLRRYLGVSTRGVDKITLWVKGL